MQPRVRARRRAPAAAAALAVLLLPTPGPAFGLADRAPTRVTVHGYLKEFFLALEQNVPGLEDDRESLSRARLMLEGAAGQHVVWGVHYEHLATVNPPADLVSGTSPLLLGTSAAGKGRQGAVQLAWPIMENQEVRWRHEIDRLYLTARAGRGELTLGRQAISWATGLFWTPGDLFVAFSPVEIDREFKAGVDAARLIVATGPLAQIELVYAAFDSDIDSQVAAARWQTTAGGTDIGLFGGKSFEDAVAGLSASGEVAGVGLLLDATFTRSFADSPGPQAFLRVVGGASYRFRNRLLVHAEYYFNGFGTSDPAGYTRLLGAPRLRRGEVFNLGRHYLGTLADYEAHPLLHLGALLQWNLTDPSALAGPTFTLSLSDEAELRGGAYFAAGARFDGRIRSEFGLYPDIFFLEAKIFF